MQKDRGAFKREREGESLTVFLLVQSRTFSFQMFCGISITSVTSLVCTLLCFGAREWGRLAQEVQRVCGELGARARQSGTSKNIRGLWG